MLVSDFVIVPDHKFAYLLSNNIAHSARAPCKARALKTARAARSVVKFLCCSHLQKLGNSERNEVSGTIFILTPVNQSKHSNLKKKQKQTNKKNKYKTITLNQPKPFLWVIKGPKRFIWSMAYLQPTKLMVFK